MLQRRLAAVILLAIASALPAVAQSRRGEMRGAWMGEGYNRDWPAIMRSLKENGFNALFPNFCTGSLAYYPSKVLAAAKGAPAGRDELAEAVRAAKEQGIELHVWRINWALWGVPQEVLAGLEAEGRLQRNWQGKLGREDPGVTVDWLCPSNPENRKLEKEAMLELVRSYDIAGIQFDYMRFPNGDYCFCDHCKEQFQSDTKIKVGRWPEDVQEGGPCAEQWREWRRGLITSLAKEISEECRRAKPGIHVSLAAWPHLEAAYNQVGQDWTTWVKEGVLDFVCPMDYTTSTRDLVENQLAGQLEEVGGAIPVYAGLGAFLMKSSAELIEQVQAAREAGADGFVAFAYFSGDLDKWLPDLRATVTTADPNPMPHWAPAARFSFGGPAVAGSRAPGQVIAGEQLEVSATLGTPLRSPNQEVSEGAAQAATVLRQATDTRSPVTSYETPPLLGGSFEEERRLAGRVVVENPSGMTLGALGAFEGEPGVTRTLRLVAPEGPFRVAIYGSVSTGGVKKRDFVARAVLLTGVKAEAQAGGEGVREELERRYAEMCAGLRAEQIAGLNATLQMHATGPGGGDWWLRFREGRCEYGAGEIEGPELTVTGSAEDLLAIARREAEPFDLWGAGRLRVVGDGELLRRVGKALGYRTG